VTGSSADRAARVALGVLAATGFLVGAWAAFFPRSFYDDFPGAGRVWVAVDGPYNEHLVRDVGALNLALGVAALVALVTLSRAAVVAAGAAWAVYSLPHLVYHLRHLDVYDGTDAVTTLVALVGALVLPVVVLVVELRRPGDRSRQPA
jgi:hypothetical protein